MLLDQALPNALLVSRVATRRLSWARPSKPGANGTPSALRDPSHQPDGLDPLLHFFRLELDSRRKAIFAATSIRGRGASRRQTNLEGRDSATRQGRPYYPKVDGNGYFDGVREC